MRTRDLRWVTPSLVAASLVFVAPAMAAPSAVAVNATQQAAIHAAQTAESRLPAASSVAQAQQQVASLVPAVKAVIATGSNAERELVYESANNARLAGALMEADGKPESNGAAESVVPHADVPAPYSTGLTSPSDPCYRLGDPHIVNPAAYFQIAGNNVIDISFDYSSWWCGAYGYISQLGGDSYYFTSYGGPTFQSSPWTWGAYCVTGYKTPWGWDVWPSWIHMMATGGAGVEGIPGLGSTCVNLYGTLHAVLRINAAGGADNYDDFGF